MRNARQSRKEQHDRTRIGKQTMVLDLDLPSIIGMTDPVAQLAVSLINLPNVRYYIDTCGTSHSIPYPHTVEKFAMQLIIGHIREKSTKYITEKRKDIPRHLVILRTLVLLTLNLASKASSRRCCSSSCETVWSFVTCSDHRHHANLPDAYL